MHLTLHSTRLQQPYKDIDLLEIGATIMILKDTHFETIDNTVTNVINPSNSH